jgi:hypothetical protein
VAAAEEVCEGGQVRNMPYVFKVKKNQL